MAGFQVTLYGRFWVTPKVTISPLFFNMRVPLAYAAVRFLKRPHVILNEPRIRALVGQRKTASVAQHLRVSE
jgi:hypothetical protein